MDTRNGTVLFLGAGASRDAGVPTTPELLPRILEFLEDGTLFGTKAPHNVQARRELRELLEVVFPQVFTAQAPPITDLLSLIDHMIVFQEAPAKTFPVERLIPLRRSLERAMLWILANPTEKKEPKIKSRLVAFFNALVQENQQRGCRTCFITTNYDRIFDELAFKSVGRHGDARPSVMERRRAFAEKVDLGYSWRERDKGALVDRPRDPLFGLYKLHGSSSWLGCPLCGQVYATHQSVYTVASWPKVTPYNSCHCGYGPLKTVIIAPSLTRGLMHASLLSIWQSSLEALRTSADWIFVGYSLPNEDIAIRSLLLRGYRARKKPPRVRVVQRSDNPERTQRYQFLFPDCVVSTGGFGMFIDEFMKDSKPGR